MSQASAKESICALCLEQKALCRSHIIPEFIFKSIYDQTGRLHIRSGDPDLPNRLAQKGFWQKLLCQACETTISRWERYAELLFAGSRAEVTSSIEGKVLWLHGLDYASMKLFLLSILWRSSVTRHRFFEHVALGPHEDVLRRMLLKSDPGHPQDYACMTSLLLADGEVSRDIIVEPTKTRMFDHRAYRFVFGGHFWAYCIATSRQLPRGPEWHLSGAGSLPILLSELSEVTFITELMAKVHRLGRAPNGS